MIDRWNAFLPYPGAPVPNAADGPLAGLRLAVKDLFDVAGYPTSAGNPLVLAASGIKTSTAPLVRQLLDAGARFVGKTNTDELAYSLIGHNAHFGMPLNPAYLDLIPGGSSSGSAVAVAAGLADIGLGTDTSGSIRLPAAANGVIGWRPTHGMLDVTGLRSLAPSFDVPAFAAGSLAMIGKVMDAVNVPRPSTTPSAIVISDEILDACEPDIASQFMAAFEKRGLRMKPIPKLSSLSLGELGLAFTTILQSEAWQTNKKFFLDHGYSIAPDIAGRLLQGSRLNEREVAEALDVRQRFRSDLDGVLDDGAALAMPTLPMFPPARDTSPDTLKDFRSRSISILCLSGLSGCPQISGPIQSGKGAPASVSLLMAKQQDRTLPPILEMLLADFQTEHWDKS